MGHGTWTSRGSDIHHLAYNDRLPHPKPGNSFKNTLQADPWTLRFYRCTVYQFVYLNNHVFGSTLFPQDDDDNHSLTSQYTRFAWNIRTEFQTCRDWLVWDSMFNLDILWILPLQYRPHLPGLLWLDHTLHFPSVFNHFFVKELFLKMYHRQ